MAEALYRKYRPQVFEDVVGQEPIERTLKNALAQDKVSHAYLFCGPRGTGKTTTARLLAKALLCQGGPTPDPDGTCEDCQLIADGAHPDVYELDAASRTGVENVREEIISRVQFAPTRGRYKVYIIDEVHMLSTAAFNALLKTLEEPPGHVVFILCTTDPQKVPETIHSRCQRFDFRRIAPESMVSRLGAICIAEDVEFEGEALDLIAHRAEGGLRNALTSLEQIIAFENGKVTLAGAERLLGSIDSSDLAEIMAYVGRRDIANCFRWTASYVETGADLAQFVRDMAEHARNLYVMALVGDDVDLDVSETCRRQLASELQWFGADRASRLLGVLGDLSAELKTSSNPRLAFEIALTRMVRPDSDLTLEALAERIEALESGYSSVAHVLPGNPVVAPASRPGAESADVPEASGWSGGPDATAAAPVAVPETTRWSGGPDATAAAPVAVPETTRWSSGPDVGEGFPVGAHSVRPASEASQVPATTADGAATPSDSQPSQGAAGGAGRTECAPMGESPRQGTASGLPDAGGQDALSALANPAALQRIWQAALTALKKQKAAYGVLFMGTRTRFDVDAGRVMVSFPAENAFAFNAVQKPDVQDALAEALRKALGADVPFAYEQAGEAASAVVASRANSQSEIAGEEDGSLPDDARRDAHRASAGEADTLQPAQPSWQESAGTLTERPPSEASQGSAANAGHDAAPYEQVPYEDIPYDPVPYDDFEPAAPNTAPSDVSTAPSPGDNASPDGVTDIEAMLQAGFGGNVVFSEVDE